MNYDDGKAFVCSHAFPSFSSNMMISINNSALALVSIMILLQSVLSQNLTQVACGNGITGNGLCDDSTLCCSSYGYCGTGADYCTMLTEDPATTAPVSNAPVMAPPGNSSVPCGNGEVGNGNCEVSSECCSFYGYCGTSTDHCSKTAAPATDDQVSRAPVAPAISSGPCGSGQQGNGKCDVSGECCSMYGYCGVGTQYCTGTSSAPVSTAPVLAPAISSGPCGSGQIGNGKCDVSSECCSKNGYCGIGIEYCTGTSQAPVTNAPNSRAPTSSSGTAAFLVSIVLVVLVQTILLLHIP